jgi:hypothetical protein
VNLRDRTERVLRAWDRHERDRGGEPVIDFDCHPSSDTHPGPVGRLDALDELSALHRQVEDTGDAQLADTLTAHRAYLRCLLGERPSLDEYMRVTQGCAARGWPADYVEEVGETARRHLADVGISWGPNTERELEEAEGRLDVDDASDAIRQAADDLEPVVRKLADTTAPYRLSIETTHVDAYWSYWLDGIGDEVRLRLNLRNARFTRVQARQFTLHEVLGHGLQSASYAQRCADKDVPWVRLLAVHAPHQVLLEGLAQAMPLFVTPDDPALVARVRLSHYTQLISAELHGAINAGRPVEECAAHARARVPFWTSGRIGDLLADRGTNPLLRSYLWAYPAGLDWFVALADRGTTLTAQEVIRAAYRDPLTPSELTALWPAGPPIGGP